MKYKFEQFVNVGKHKVVSDLQKDIICSLSKAGISYKEISKFSKLNISGCYICNLIKSKKIGS
jgi:hypothetical protein